MKFEVFPTHLFFFIYIYIDRSFLIQKKIFQVVLRQLLNITRNILTMVVAAISAATNIPEQNLRLVLSILLAYPIALVYRITFLRPLKSKWAPFIRNLISLPLVFLFLISLAEAISNIL